MIICKVYLSPEAEGDIIAIHEYIFENETLERADNLIDELEQQILSLQGLPKRGHFPPELKRLNIQNYQEIHHKNFRIIYEIKLKSIYIHAVLDMRRDLQDILIERFLR